MSRLVELLRGLPRAPLDEPLKALIGAYTAGVAMLLLGALGAAEELMTHGALLAIGAGLSLTVPTVLAAVFDWWDIPKGTPARTGATLHLGFVGVSTVLFALTFALHVDAYGNDEVTTGAWIVGLGALALLAGGGYAGRALAFPFRRTRGRSQTPVSEAQTARLEREQAAEPPAQGGQSTRLPGWPRRRGRPAQRGAAR